MKLLMKNLLKSLVVEVGNCTNPVPRSTMASINNGFVGPSTPFGKGIEVACQPDE